MVPGDKQELIEKISELTAAYYVINLENGVHDKNNARKQVYKYINKSSNKDKIIVRVNSLETCGKKDIKLINMVRPLAICLSKIKNVQDIKIALELIHKDIDVHLCIETSQSLQSLITFGIHERVTTVYLEISDVLESLYLPQTILTVNNPSIDYILGKFLVDSKSANLNPVSFAFKDYNDTEKFTLWCNKVHNMGFISKACICPSQVKIANNLFIINSVEMIDARNIVKLYEKNMRNGIVGFSDLKYGYIDEPAYKNAKLTLSKI